MLINCRGGCGRTRTTNENEFGGWICPECQVKEWNAPSGEHCKKCNKELNKKECKIAHGRDSNNLLCNDCYLKSDQAPKCTKCKQPFKEGENYTKVEDSSRAGNYHKSCWAEVERERNDPNSNLTCYKCKNSISEEEKNVSAKIPGNFNLHYCKSCYKEETCSKCNRFRNGDDTLCFDCRIVENNLRIPPPNRNNGNDDTGGGGGGGWKPLPQVFKMW